MYRIFISYRRSDSESFSGRLRDRLRAEFGKRAIFMDTSTIPGGARFDEAIAQNLKSCKVFIAVIGKTWLDGRNEAGQRRLDDPEDWVRKEVARALARDDVLVIPVIFGGAVMPGSESLPPDLQPLAMRNAVSINDADFDSDVVRLIEACEPHVPRPRRWPWLAGAAAAAAAMVAVGGWFWHDAGKTEFRGIYVVPGPGIAGSLPIRKNHTRPKKPYLVLASGGRRMNISDLTLKSVLIVSESGLDGTPTPQDIDELKTRIAQHFESQKALDFDATAATLSSEPIVVSTLRVRPGAKVNAELGLAGQDAAGGEVREVRARCEFLIPEKPAVSTPIFYIVKASGDCK